MRHYLKLGMLCALAGAHLILAFAADTREVFWLGAVGAFCWIAIALSKLSERINIH